jgi:hypothetical protein
MTFTPEFVLQILIAVGSAFGVYAGVRADLARIHERATSAHESANEAHRRIDGIMTTKHP